MQAIVVELLTAASCSTEVQLFKQSTFIAYNLWIMWSCMATKQFLCSIQGAAGVGPPTGSGHGRNKGRRGKGRNRGGTPLTGPDAAVTTDTTTAETLSPSST